MGHQLPSLVWVFPPRQQTHLSNRQISNARRQDTFFLHLVQQSQPALRSITSCRSWTTRLFRSNIPTFASLRRPGHRFDKMALTWREAAQKMYGGDRLSSKDYQLEKKREKLRKQKDDDVFMDTDYHLL